MEEITRFDMDMDGSMEPSDHGRWVRYEDVPQPTWEGLSVFEINDLVASTEHGLHELVERTEKLLKEKNTSNGGCV